MKKRIHPALLFLLILLITAGILYVLGMYETFGVLGASLTAVVLTLLIVFFMG